MAALYQSIADTIRERIASGQYETGEGLPSERKLCEEFSVSRVTIRKALQLLKNRGLLDTCIGTGHFVGSAPGSGSAGARTVVLVVPDLSFCRLTPDRDIFAALRQRLAAATPDAAAVMMEGADFLRTAEREPPGAAVAVFSGDASLQKAIARTGIAFVVVGSPDAGVNAPSVDVDQAAIGYDSARHALELGHETIGIVYHRPSYAGDRLWLEGVHRAFAERGRRCDPPLMFAMPEAGLSEIDAPVLAIVERLLKKQKATAVVAANGWIANSVLRAAAQLGVAVPEDLSLIAGETPRPPAGNGKPISGCLVDYATFGRAIANALLQAMKGGDAGRRVIPHRFVRGWTSRPPAGRPLQAVGRKKPARKTAVRKAAAL